MFQECSTTTDISVGLFVLLQSGFQPLNGLSNVDLSTMTGDLVDDHGAIISDLDPGQHGAECLPRLEDHFEVVLTSYTPDVLAHS